MEQIPPIFLKTLCYKMQGSVCVDKEGMQEYFRSGENLLKLLALVGKAIDIETVCPSIGCDECKRKVDKTQCIRTIIRHITRKLNEKPQLQRLYFDDNYIGDFTEDEIEKLTEILLKHPGKIRVSKL